MAGKKKKGRSGKRGGSSGKVALAPLPKALEELIKSKGLFGKTPKPPPPKVQSILGDSALVNGRWMKVGQPKGNIVVKEIGSNKVVLEVNGQRKEYTIWSKLPGT